jgi:adenosylmethionine-8-amino-7-oxononanoate aminotransferase
MGQYMIEGLKDRLLHYPIVGDIRGLGLLIGIEIVADKKTKGFFPPESNFYNRALDKMESNGLLAREFEQTFLFTPPLCITKSDVDEIIDIMDKVIGELATEFGS